jgi:hypothetical protein
VHRIPAFFAENLMSYLPEVSYGSPAFSGKEDEISGFIGISVYLSII